jgi:hypothetical protein
LLVLLGVSFACSDPDDPPNANTVPGEVSTPGGSPNPPTGQFFEHLEDQLPADFPADFPVYDGAEIARGDTLHNRYAIDLRTPDEMDSVAEWYRTGLATSPWEIVEEKPGDGSIIFTFSSTDGIYDGEVAIGKLQDRTWILIAMNRPQ